MPTHKKPKSRKMGPRRKRAPRVSLYKAVRSVINKVAEKKNYMTGVSNYGLGDTLTAGNTLEIAFQPSQGTQQSQRIGNKVRLLSVVVRGHVNVTALTGTANQYNMITKVFLCAPKAFAAANTITAGLVAGIMQSGSTSSTLGPDVRSYYRPFNRDLWDIYGKRDMKIGSNLTTTAGVTGYNNDFKNMVPFFFKLKPNKVISFDDATAAPQDFRLYIAAVSIDSLGSSASTIGYSEFTFEAVFTYTDI